MGGVGLGESGIHDSDVVPAPLSTNIAWSHDLDEVFGTHNSPLQRLAARRRRTATLGRLGQLPVHRGNVAPPERQPLPHLISHLETAPGPLIELTPGPGRLDPPPHSPLRDAPTLSRELHMPRRQPTFTIQPHQARRTAASRGSRLIPPSRTLLTHARFPPISVTPRDPH